MSRKGIDSPVLIVYAVRATPSKSSREGHPSSSGRVGEDIGIAPGRLADALALLDQPHAEALGLVVRHGQAGHEDVDGLELVDHRDVDVEGMLEAQDLLDREVRQAPRQEIGHPPAIAAAIAPCLLDQRPEECPLHRVTPERVYEEGMLACVHRDPGCAFGDPGL